jgi:membrane-associated phospholipid phosphatase
VLVVLAALAYFGVRGLTQSGVGAAFRHAGDVVGAEKAIGIAWEQSLQELIIDQGWLVALANWVYIYGHWPVVIGVLMWLFLKHREAFFTLRDAMFISGAIGLVVFMAFPTAPPRLADLGLLDTVTQRSSSYRTLQPPGLINKYAAMPSLHFGWNLLVGVMVFRIGTRRVVKAFAIVLPIAMATAVVMTANHYILDVVAGGVVALAGLALVPTVNRAVLRLHWSQSA